MLTRIVKMSFHPENIPVFLNKFDEVKELIRNTQGVHLLELHQDIENPSIFFTYSQWESEADLENYRKSALFNEVWTFTKALFNGAPEAWSLDQLVRLP